MTPLGRKGYFANRQLTGRRATAELVHRRYSPYRAIDDSFDREFTSNQISVKKQQRKSTNWNGLHKL